MIERKIKYLVTNPNAVLSHVNRISCLSQILDVPDAAVKMALEESKRYIPSSQIHYELPVRSAEMLYCTTRIVKPDVMVETGIASGMSSKIILEAMELNNSGKLYSIDPTKYVGQKIVQDQVQNARVDDYKDKELQVGHLVPDSLRHRWEMIVGFSQDVLPRLFQKLQKVDMFLHDSAHDKETMYFEYTEAWKVLRKNGILLSDDIGLSKGRGTFQSFCKNKGAPYHDFLNFGIARKLE